jgi:hypothetical protein
LTADLLGWGLGNRVVNRDWVLGKFGLSRGDSGDQTEEAVVVGGLVLIPGAIVATQVDALVGPGQVRKPGFRHKCKKLSRLGDGWRYGCNQLKG